MYSLGYTRDNLFKSGIPRNIVDRSIEDRSIKDKDGEVIITVYYYNADYFG